MRLVDKLDKHKILDKLEFRPDLIIQFGMTCPLVQKKTHIWPCSEHSLLSVKWNFMKLADNLDRYKISQVF